MGVYGSWIRQNADPRAGRRSARLERFIDAGRRLFFRSPTPVVPSSDGWDGQMPFLEPALRKSRALAGRRTPPRPRIVHLIGTLGPGGAERQLCNFVIAAHRMGHDVRVMLIWEPEGELGHYYPLLERAHVPVTIAGRTFHPDFPRAVANVPGGIDAVKQVPAECWPVVGDLVGEFATDRPDILHAWLDGSNVWGGMAAVIAQVPRIILSTRNVNPMNFPSLSRPFYQRAYRELLRSPTVRLINNSHAGAEDYARWLGIDKDRVAVVLNGLDVSGLRPASPDAIARFRERWHVPAEARVIAGVFRLAEEKQPFVFLDVIAGLVSQYRDVVAVVAGIGPLENDVREQVRARGLDQHVRLVGRLADVTPLYSTAHLTLLCSRKEGTPNVLLESQWLGCPVVATRAGGAVDAVSDGRTGYLADVGDVQGLGVAVRRLLDDPASRREMAENAPAFITSRFSVEQMVRTTLRLYESSHEREFAR